MKFIAKLLAFLIFANVASAQFGSVSNVAIKGFIAPGYTDVATNGAIRWNPTIMLPQVFTGTNWVLLSTGGTPGGTGSGFPLTNNGSAAWWSLFDIGTAVGSNALFQSVLASNVTIGSSLEVTGTNTTLRDTVVNGNLIVNGQATYVTRIDVSSNVYSGTYTTYVHETVYDTQVVYQTTLIFTNAIVTNQVDTFVNVGGSFTMGAGSTFNATGATTVIFPYFSAVAGAGVTATGVWNLVDAQVYVANPTGGTQVANYQTVTDKIHQAVSSLNIGGVTNLHTVGPITGSIDIVSGTLWLTSTASTVSSSNLNYGISLFSDSGGGLSFTNSAGNQEPLSLSRHSGIPNPTINRTYDAQDTWSNLNYNSAVQYWVTNGMAYATRSNLAGAATGLDYQNITSGRWVKISVRISQPFWTGFSAGGAYNSGIAWRDSGGSNNMWGTYSSGSGAVPMFEAHIFGLSYYAAQDTRYVSPYQAGSFTLYPGQVLGANNLYWFICHDGTNRVWYGIGAVADAPICTFYATNVSPIVGVGMWLYQSAATQGTTTNKFGAPLIWDDLKVKEGELWFDPSTFTP